MNYTVKFGETITDVLLNSTGSISSWETSLELNGFLTWTPELSAGQLLYMSDVIDPVTISALSSYPTNNRSVSDLSAQIDAVLAILLTAAPADVPVIVPEIIDTTVYYTVNYGETMTDVVLNATGNINSWTNIITANGFTEWVPLLSAGQRIIIPVDALPDPNSLRALQTYPTNNASVPDVYDQINVIFGDTLDLWILKNGYWEDTGRWQDWSHWID